MNFLNINDDASHVTISALYSRDSPQQNCFHAQHQAIIWAIHHHLSYWQQFFPSSSFHLILQPACEYSNFFFPSSCFKEAHTLWKWNDEMWGMRIAKNGGGGWVGKLIRCTLQRNSLHWNILSATFASRFAHFSYFFPSSPYYLHHVRTRFILEKKERKLHVFQELSQ